MDLKKIWHFIWEEDSLMSWLVNIILAFLIIKFLLYPFIGLLLGTSYPIVAVVSSSMEHGLVEDNNDLYYLCGNYYNGKTKLDYWSTCGSWYEEKGITKKEFDSYIFKNGFNKGDIIILTSKKNVEKGDVIVFWANRAYPIIHRVVDVNESNYNTKGDHNKAEDGFVNEERLIGKALFRIPFLGWIKIWFVNFLNLIIP